MKLPKSFIVLTFLFAFILHIGETKAQEINLKVEGSTVMYDSPNFTLGPYNNLATYVVKLSKVLDGKENSQYILMLSTASFSKNQFDVKKIQHFNLIRISGWGDKISNKVEVKETTDKRIIVPRLIPSKGLNLNKIPIDETLPEYIFFGNDYPNKWWLNLKKT